MALPSLADVMQLCFAGITMDATYGLVFSATGAEVRAWWGKELRR